MRRPDQQIDRPVVARRHGFGIEPCNFSAGGLDRVVRLQRLPDTMTQCRVALKRRIKARSNGDTRLYVRAQQEDGHRMWSSPIFLFQD
jgi:hypothetical protein